MGEILLFRNSGFDTQKLPTFSVLTQRGLEKPAQPSTTLDPERKALSCVDEERAEGSHGYVLLAGRKAYVNQANHGTE